MRWTEKQTNKKNKKQKKKMESTALIDFSHFTSHIDSIVSIDQFRKAVGLENDNNLFDVIKVIPEICLVGFNDSVYRYHDWRANIDAFYKSFKPTKHTIIFAGRAPLGMLLYAGSKTSHYDVNPFEQIFDVVNHFPKDGNLVSWRISNIKPGDAASHVSFNCESVFQHEHGSIRPKYLVFCITTFNKLSETNATSIRNELNDPFADIFEIYPSMNDKQLEVTQDNVFGIVHEIHEHVRRTYNDLKYKDSARIAMSFAGPASLAFLVGMTVQNQNVFGDMTFLNYRNQKYEVCA